MPDSVSPAGSEYEKGKQPLKSMDSREKALICAREASRFKALDLVVLEVSKISSFADYFIICSGKSSRQVQGIADNIESSLRDRGVRPLGVEGKREGHWVLMDYGDVIIHVFYEPARYFYDLESLWADASRLGWEEGQAEGLREQDSRSV
jgi:ribosome-associated protein